MMDTTHDIFAHFAHSELMRRGIDITKTRDDDHPKPGRVVLPEPYLIVAGVR
jgi:hypothetical protein